MKKIIALVLAFAMLLSSTSAFAAVTEAGKGESTESVYDVYVAGEVGNSKLASKVQIIFNNGEEIGNIHETNVDSEGKYEYKFKFAGDIDGYTLTVRDADGTEDITDTIKAATYKHEMIVHDMRVVNNGTNASIAEGDCVYVNATVKNKYGNENLTVKYVLAAYDETGMLLGIKEGDSVDYSYFADEAKVIDFSAFTMPAGTVKAKVYAWTDLENMIPVGNSSSITDGVTVHFFGSSTTTRNYSSTYNYPQQGMSYDFERYLASGVRVTDYAIGGWSLKTLQELSQTKKPSVEGAEYLYDPDTSKYAQMLADAKAGDFVIFGSTGNNERYQTKFDGVVEKDGELVTDYTGKQSAEEYKARLDATVKELLSLGITPIILTDLGKHTESAYNDLTTASDYVQPQIEVCEDNGIDFIDHRTLAYSEAKANGYDYEAFAGRYIMTNAAKLWYQEYDKLGTLYTNNAEKLADNDYVHFTVEGALLFSRGIVAGLKATDNPINKYFIDK